jgi:hypothetical protein
VSPQREPHSSPHSCRPGATPCKALFLSSYGARSHSSQVPVLMETSERQTSSTRRRRMPNRPLHLVLGRHGQGLELGQEPAEDALIDTGAPGGVADPRPSGVAASASSTRTRRPAVLEVTSDCRSARSGVAPCGRATKELTARSLGWPGVFEPIPLGVWPNRNCCGPPELRWSGQATGLRAAQSAGRPAALPQLQGGDLVRGHHRVPGVTVGRDGDPERAAALDRLALGDDAGVGDPGGVAVELLGEPHGAVG